MNKANHILRLAGLVVLCFLGSLILLLVFALAVHSGYDDLLFHLLGGFYFFLRGNVSAISTDAGTWAPGLAAFTVATLIAHRMLRSWASGTNRAWSFLTTACIVGVVPILFVIAFIVPGILLQLASLRDVKWFKPQYHHAAYYKLVLRNYAQACNSLALEHPDGRLPDSLGEIHERSLMTPGFIDPSDEMEIPTELPIYLGAGWSNPCDPAQPLLISPPYQANGKSTRCAITRGGNFLEIPEEQTDAWIDRALGQRRPLMENRSRIGTPPASSDSASGTGSRNTGSN